MTLGAAHSRPHGSQTLVAGSRPIRAVPTTWRGTGTIEIAEWEARKLPSVLGEVAVKYLLCARHPQYLLAWPRGNGRRPPRDGGADR